MFECLGASLPAVRARACQLLAGHCQLSVAVSALCRPVVVSALRADACPPLDALTCLRAAIAQSSRLDGPACGLTGAAVAFRARRASICAAGRARKSTPADWTPASQRVRDESDHHLDGRVAARIQNNITGARAATNLPSEQQSVCERRTWHSTPFAQSNSSEQHERRSTTRLATWQPVPTRVFAHSLSSVRARAFSQRQEATPNDRKTSKLQELCLPNRHLDPAK